MKKSSDSVSATVVDVLQQFTQCSQESNWVIEQHDGGAQASIFVVRRCDGEPIRQRHHELVVKLYKSTGRQSVEVARDQFESLSRLHAQLNGSTVEGWKIDSPAPLYRCERPAALVMTMVPGRPLTHCLRTAGQVTAESIESIADAIVVVMERFWQADGGLYGELNFDNILCDVSRKRLSFVDPGSLEKVFLCDTVTKHWFPASRDLAYLLYDTETSVRTTIGNPGARQRQKRLAEKILRAFMKRAEHGYRNEYLLDEIGGCARMHLNRIKASWSPRGIWRSFVKQTASRSIDQTLGRLKSDAVVSMTVSPAECIAGSKR
jgi:hypothetical protein